MEMLTRLGWSAPTCGRGDGDPGAGSANFYLDLDRSMADRLAVMTVRALRDVFGVVHPVFLSADNLAQDDEAAPDHGMPSSQPSPVSDPDEPIAVFPGDRAHLRSLVDEALTPFFGHAPEHDEDGDIPVSSGSAVVFVMVPEGVPAIQLFAPLLCDVTDPDRAAFEVAVLNRDLSFIKFVATGDHVTACLYVPAWPFAPEHLRMMLAVMVEKVGEIGDDLVARVGGRRAIEPASEDSSDDETHETDEIVESDQADHAEQTDEADESRLDPAMMTLLELDVESPGSVDPELAASICGMDRDLILKLITSCSEQEIAWREARDEAISAGDSDEEAVVCDHEVQHAGRTATLLRRALRIVVERELGRGPIDSSYDERRRRRRQGKLRPQPSRGSVDSRLDEPDPENWR